MGEIRIFFGKDAPKDWLFCHGQIVPITSNTALFALLGTSYGGNGKTTFALPDFRKRAPVGTSVGIWTGAHDQHPISLPGSQETHVGPQYMIAVHNTLFPPRGDDQFDREGPRPKPSKPNSKESDSGARELAEVPSRFAAGMSRTRGRASRTAQRELEAKAARKANENADCCSRKL